VLLYPLKSAHFLSICSYMKRSHHYLLAALLLAALTACSKKEAPAPPPAPDPAPAAQSPTAQPTTAVKPVDTVQLENQVGTALQQQNYNAAVDTLAQVNSASQNLTDEQRRQYLQQLQRTMDALAQKAATDAAAKAAYERLGRIATGR